MDNCQPMENPSCIQLDELWHTLETIHDEITDESTESSIIEGTTTISDLYGICPTCGEASMGIHKGFTVCNACGTTDDMIIDTNAEWRCFNSMNGRDQAAIRCTDSRNPIMPDSFQLSTFIGDGDKRLQRVHQWNNLSTRERMLQGVNKDFESIVQSCDLPRVMYKTMCGYYYEVYTAMDDRNYGVKRCNIKNGLMAACLYYACIEHGMPREIKEIAQMLDYERKSVTKGCTLFAEVMGDKFLHMKPFKPSDFLDRFCALLCVDFGRSQVSRRTLQWMEEKRCLNDCTPPAVTCAVIYYVCKTSKATEVTPAFIQKNCNVSKTVLLKLVEKIESIGGLEILVKGFLLDHKLLTLL